MLRSLKRAVMATVMGVVALVMLLYAGDYAVFAVRVRANRNPYGSVIVRHYYAVAQKSGKTQFIFDPPQAQSCANALFPHGGLNPCWYLTRHPEQATNI